MNLKRNFYKPYKILMILYIFMILFGFIISTPTEISSGLKNILFTPDILITDYIQVGGLGAGLINAALTSVLCLLLLVFSGIVPGGSTIMALWLVTGFAFLGKNMLNIWPIVFGVYLYSRYKKENFANYTLAALLGTCLSPVVTQLYYSGYLPKIPALIIGIFLGIFVGFILPPVASNCARAHNGYDLYNVGFACGIIGTMLMSLFRIFNITFESRLEWYTGNQTALIIMLFIIFIYLIIVGLISSKNIKTNMINMTKESGRLVSDFYAKYGETVYINMGILGILSTLFVLALGIDINGGSICGIFTIVGFGCFGKNVRNVFPVMIGATIAAIIHINPVSSAGLTLAILFSTCLAPISGTFGWKFGVLAGFIHVGIVCNTGYLHGALNLYNNGFAAGFTAMILVPLITALKKDS